MVRVILALCLAVIAWSSQALLLRHLGQLDAGAATHLMVPRADVAKLMATDFENVGADVTWIQALVFNGEQLQKQKGVPRDFTGLADAFDLVTELDPRFHDATLFGSWALADADQVSASERLVVKAMNRFPEKWEYPFQLAFIEFLYGRDARSAADHFMQASRLPDCPPNAAHMAAGLYAKGNKTDLAIATWRNIYEHGDDRIRGIARRALEHLGVNLPD
jgi:hypothetical protein